MLLCFGGLAVPTFSASRHVPCNCETCSQAEAAATVNQTATYAGSGDVAASSGCRAASPVTVSLVEGAAWITVLACPYVVELYPSHEASIILFPEELIVGSGRDGRVCCID